MKQFKCPLAVTAAILALLLYACQASPEHDVVISKNNGLFEDRLRNNAAGSEKENPTETVQYCEAFYSTDGSVKFLLDVDQQIDQAALPVVEVSPHYLTGSDVEKVVQAIFGDAEVFEQEPSSNPQYAKSQLRSKIDFWSKYANERKLKEPLGYYGPGDLERIQEIIVWK